MSIAIIHAQTMATSILNDPVVLADGVKRCLVRPRGQIRRRLGGLGDIRVRQPKLGRGGQAGEKAGDVFINPCFDRSHLLQNLGHRLYTNVTFAQPEAQSLNR